MTARGRLQRGRRGVAGTDLFIHVFNCPQIVKKTRLNGSALFFYPEVRLWGAGSVNLWIGG